MLALLVNGREVTGLEQHGLCGPEAATILSILACEVEQYESLRVQIVSTLLAAKTDILISVS